jgi:hypothetical protein
MTPYYVYRHYKLDTNDVFYIGMGKENNFRRAFSKRYRNNYWLNTVSKYGYSVDIVSKNLSEEDAIELEIFLIKEYGRKDLGNGLLVNMTDGGEGAFNPSPESLKNKSGIKSHWSKRVINVDTNEIYISLVECCKVNNLNYSSMKYRLRGVRKNKTPYTYIDELNQPIGKYNENIIDRNRSYDKSKNKICINIKTHEKYVNIRDASLKISVNRNTLKSDINKKIYKYGIMYLENYKPNGKSQHIINNKYTTL